VAVFPSDHDMRDETAFRRHVARMASLEAIERTLEALRIVPPWRAPLSATA